ncbi:hypothetical protein SAMN05428949_1397 [Chitinophaga sp. YR627]|uniref:hypothetical protein n=1 Tax=Chitinophaga sp. YR627 TaxID=1881041 RepID=UPI0008E19020|nr:hypothetical protein [Chitinophaga sp. YR627]SFM94024.1 hypothetical protein SAMN05428949_1397 [Chitinophaga sp. YR627]
MRTQNKDLGNNAITFRLALCKIGITTCLAIILSLFLFSCGSSKESGNTTDSSSIIQSDTTSTVDTMNRTMDTSSVRPDSMPIK